MSHSPVNCQSPLMQGTSVAVGSMVAWTPRPRTQPHAHSPPSAVYPRAQVDPMSSPTPKVRGSRSPSGPSTTQGPQAIGWQPGITLTHRGARAGIGTSFSPACLALSHHYWSPDFPTPTTGLGGCTQSEGDPMVRGYRLRSLGVLWLGPSRTECQGTDLGVRRRSPVFKVWWETGPGQGWEGSNREGKAGRAGGAPPGSSRPQWPGPVKQETHPSSLRCRREEEGRARADGQMRGRRNPPRTSGSWRQPVVPGPAPGRGTRPGVWAASCPWFGCRSRAVKGALVGARCSKPAGDAWAVRLRRRTGRGAEVRSRPRPPLWLVVTPLLVVPEPRVFAAAYTRGTGRLRSISDWPSDHGLLPGGECGAVAGPRMQWGLPHESSWICSHLPRGLTLGAASKSPGSCDSGYRSGCPWEVGAVNSGKWSQPPRSHRAAPVPPSQPPPFPDSTAPAFQEQAGL
ncbi:hypothetical protein Cadr_000031037 [Camelus dromedarius]|uniref:Uncharacterized protein n=1 Tax=Camelus dromedarius TaxID=9838 RepID=A0A5N4C0D9_CAMDR|nr:hypothetical protein Cadr_000031037 [Camelus dromedarius]